MNFLLRIFTWWNRSQTSGIRLFTARKGVKVGEEGKGNAYSKTPTASAAG